ncbi:hypothetical protein [Streptomyces marincola]|uniref:hypothetical protein n=1 Tax=Streptomyces marincola TaxID=2878388 RepID=UPI00131E6B7E|nr:hypothetical protein [Streptomyces marincola]
MSETGPEPTPLHGVPEERFAALWADRAHVPRKRPFLPSVPLLLNGTPVENLERMNEEIDGPLYMTPTAYESNPAIAAFTDRMHMVREAARLRVGGQLRAAYGYCYEPHQVPSHLDLWVHMDWQGNGFRVPSDEKVADLRYYGANDVFSSISACRFAYSIFEHIDFRGNEYMLNAPCSLSYLAASDWNDKISSVINWGPKGPPW